MQTQTINAEPSNNNLSFLNLIVVSVMGGFILFSGFIMSLFLLAISAILFPFVAFKIWLLQRQFKENMQSAETSDIDEGTVIEGEYVVTENSKDDQ